MYRYCISFAILFAVSSGFRIEQFALSTDYDLFVDMVLNNIQSSFPAYLSGMPLELEISETGGNASDPVANLSCAYSIFGDFKSVQRTAPVNSGLGPGSLTLTIDVAFQNLSVIYNNCTFSVFGQNFEITITVDVKKNKFRMQPIIHSLANGSCAVDLPIAKFLTISDITMKVGSLGFFNQLESKVTISNLVQSVLNQFNNINVNLLQQRLQREICSLVTL